jgi:maltose phosphorylase
VNDPDYIHKLFATLSFSDNEVKHWQQIIDQLYYPADSQRGIFLQQDGFMDKELIPVAEMDPNELPINQKWSWDRILRSSCIKQADVLQGIYFFEDEFEPEEIKRNFDFYEPLTVHESSLSACVHAILASSIGYEQKAYEMYLRTARLDLDDYNNDTEDGCHITSMAGAWLAITKGFGGMRVKNNRICFQPFVPNNWKGYKFSILFRGFHLVIDVRTDTIVIRNLSEINCPICMYDEEVIIGGNSEMSLPLRGAINHGEV